MRFAATLSLGALLVGVAIGAARAREPSVPTAAAPSLAEAFAAIHAHPKVDLTHSFGPKTPVWSGFGQAKMTPAVDPRTLEAYTIAKEGFRATYFAMVGQYGTHVDPPAHADPIGATVDEIPLDQMMLPMVVLDDTPFLADDPSHAFSVADLDAWEKVHGRVPRGAFVALRTDLSKAWTTDPERFRRGPLPGWSADVLAVLIEQRGAMAIGDEALDTDAGGSANGASYVLKTGHYRIEAMANLDKVPATGAFVVATWPKPERGLGFPARVFAVLP